MISARGCREEAMASTRESARREHGAHSHIPHAMDPEDDMRWAPEMGYEGLSRTTRAGRNHLQQTDVARTLHSARRLSRAPSAAPSSIPSHHHPPSRAASALRTESAMSGAMSVATVAKVKHLAAELKQRELEARRKQRAALLGGGVESQGTLTKADLQALPKAVMLSMGSLPPLGA